MATYMIRRVQLDCRGNFRPKGKRLRHYVTTERLALGGVYMLSGNEWYTVERLCPDSVR